MPGVWVHFGVELWQQRPFAFEAVTLIAGIDQVLISMALVPSTTFGQVMVHTEEVRIRPPSLPPQAIHTGEAEFIAQVVLTLCVVTPGWC